MENNSTSTETKRNLFDSLHDEVMQSDLPEAEKTAVYPRCLKPAVARSTSCWSARQAAARVLPSTPCSI